MGPSLGHPRRLAGAVSGGGSWNQADGAIEGVPFEVRQSVTRGGTANSP